MKKYVLAISALIIGIGLNAQSTLNRKIGSRHDIYNNSSWAGKDSAVFAYNAFGYEAQRITLKGQGASTWDNFLKITSDYDASGNLVGRTTENWNNGSWNFSNKYSYTYNSNNLQTEVLYQVWNTGTNWWSNSGRILYAYNANQDPSKTETFAWNGNWIPTTKKDYFYNLSNVLTHTENFIYQNNAWQPLERLNYQFAFGFVSSLEKMVDDGINGWTPVNRTLTAVNGSAVPPRISTVQLQNRDTANAVWVDSFRTTYSYFNNNLTQLFRDEYDSTTAQWTDISKNDYVYNSNNQLETDFYSDNSASSSTLTYVSKKEYTYNANNLNDRITEFNYVGNSNWIETGRDNYAYNANDSLIYNLREEFVSNAFVPNKRYFYYYDNVSVGVNEQENLLGRATLYPNPAAHSLSIEFEQKIEGACLATIFSLEGKRIRTQLSSMLSSQLQIDISNLAKANYILQIKELNTGRSSQFKFSKQ